MEIVDLHGVLVLVDDPGLVFYRAADDIEHGLVHFPVRTECLTGGVDAAPAGEGVGSLAAHPGRRVRFRWLL